MGNPAGMGCGRSKEAAPTFNKAEVKLELDDEDSSAVKEGEITGPDFGPSSDPKYGGFGGGGGFGSGGGGSDPEPEPEDSSWAKTEPVETRLLKAVRAGDVIQIEEIIKTGVISLTDPKVKSCLYEHLLYAGEAKNPVVVDLLIRHGADVDFDEAAAEGGRASGSHPSSRRHPSPSRFGGRQC